MWRVDSLGCGGTIERVFDTEAQARVVEAELLRLTSSLRVVLWCDEGVQEPGKGPQALAGVPMTRAGASEGNPLAPNPLAAIKSPPANAPTEREKTA